MLSNFDKGREFEAQYARETDPDMKARCRKRAEQYYGLDLKESKLALQQAKPHYAFGRVAVIVVPVAILLFAIVVGAKYLLPNVNMLELSGAAGLLLVVTTIVVAFTRGKVDQSGLISAAQALSGKLPRVSAEGATKLQPGAVDDGNTERGRKLP